MLTLARWLLAPLAPGDLQRLILVLLAGAGENFFKHFTVEADQVSQQANEHGLKPHNQHHCAQQQALQMPGAAILDGITTIELYH